jgi:predicted metal-dependent TIM-barrel fold hydrolase
VRASRFGIDHYCSIAMNPKEADDRTLADEVIDGLTPYLDHPRCVALGEIGFNLITPNEEHAFLRQLQMAEARKMPVIVHTPHVDKLRGTLRLLDIIRRGLHR